MTIPGTDMQANIPERATVSVENIGGIDRTKVTFEQGITVLSGRNATNRTSLLQGVMAALGSDNVSLKSDATEGRATLEFGEETYRRSLERQNGSVVTDGEPYLDESQFADLFAFLLESNEARQAVLRRQELRELIMRPVDTDAIQAEITQYEAEKRDLDERLAQLAELEARLPELEADRTRVSADIDACQEELTAERERLETANLDIETRRSEQSALEEKLEELSRTRSELERTRDRITTERESIEALEAEAEEVSETLAELSPATELDETEIEAKITEVQQKKSALSKEISQLKSTIQFNKQRLESAETTTGGESDLTDQLLADETTVACWTCGSTVERTQIEQTIEQLQGVRQDRLEERTAVTNELSEHRETLSSIEDRRSTYESTRRRLDSIESERERRESSVETLSETRSQLVAEIEELEAEIAELETEEYDDILDQQQVVNELEFELERKERKRDEIAEEISTIESKLADRESLTERRDTVQAELTTLRTQIEQIETEAVEAFNQHMDTLLELLAYGNLDRIWIDRTTQDVREGRRTVSRSSFDLKIVRSTSEGTAYEDSIDHLSESERELIGLVFALSGYLVHDVHETVPFMLLDSLEAIDADRIATLVEYFESYVPYLIVALLDEDAQALEGDHAVVTNI